MTIQISSQNEFYSCVSTHNFFLFSNLTEIFSNVISLRELFEVAATPKSQQKPDAMDSITLVELVTMKDKEIKETLKLGMHIYVSVQLEICRSVVWRNFCICIWYIAEHKIGFDATGK